MPLLQEQGGSVEQLRRLDYAVHGPSDVLDLRLATRQFGFKE
ncbi:MAG TPA: hypothetical protein VJV79_40070 [Polyangiaceae bacterium]|nr:hypothetical protein [Polyangiaceae bacterium]